MTNSLNHQEHSRNQRGVVLMLFVVGLFLASSSLFLTVLNNNMGTLRRDQNVSVALLDAKETLIAFALLGEEHYGPAGAGPGHLFCPDTNGNGLPNSPCATGSLGRLPQSVSTLLGDNSISDFNAGIDEQFWFAVDDSLRDSPATPLNTATISGLSVDGLGGIAAVLIAPGPAIASQGRPNNTASNYLESPNESSPAFVTNNGSSPEFFNDRVLFISMNEIMSPLTARIAETIVTQLNVYHATSSSYPDDASFDDPMLDDFVTVMGGAPAWFNANDWQNQTNYVRVDTDSATLTFNGCGITYTVSTSGISRDTRQC